MPEKWKDWTAVPHEEPPAKPRRFIWPVIALGLVVAAGIFIAVPNAKKPRQSPPIELDRKQIGQVTPAPAVSPAIISPREALGLQGVPAPGKEVAPITLPDELSPFEDGRNARLEYMKWINEMPRGKVKEGVLAWVQNRGTCNGGDALTTHGCILARDRVGAIDQRKKTDPEFKRGWDTEFAKGWRK